MYALFLLFIALTCSPSFAEEGDIIVFEGDIVSKTTLSDKGSVKIVERNLFSQGEISSLMEGGDVLVVERSELIQRLKEVVVQTGVFTSLLERQEFMRLVTTMTESHDVLVVRSLAIGDEAEAHTTMSYETWDDLKDAEWRRVFVACGTKPKQRTSVKIIRTEDERGWDVDIQRGIVHVPILCED